MINYESRLVTDVSEADAARHTSELYGGVQSSAELQYLLGARVEPLSAKFLLHGPQPALQETEDYRYAMGNPDAYQGRYSFLFNPAGDVAGMRMSDPSVGLKRYLMSWPDSIAFPVRNRGMTYPGVFTSAFLLSTDPTDLTEVYGDWDADRIGNQQPGWALEFADGNGVVEAIEAADFTKVGQGRYRNGQSAWRLGEVPNNVVFLLEEEGHFKS